MTAPSDHGPSDRAPDGAYVFLLFVAGDGPNSHQAKRNLAALCEGSSAGRYQVTIVDVLKDFDAASKHGILLTPTLLRVGPGPNVRIIGNLNDHESVRATLGMNA